MQLLDFEGGYTLRHAVTRMLTHTCAFTKQGFDDNRSRKVWTVKVQITERQRKTVMFLSMSMSVCVCVSVCSQSVIKLQSLDEH